MRNRLMVIGLSIIIGYYLFKWIGFTMIANSMILIVTLVGVAILVIKSQRFDHNKSKHTKLTYFILGLIFLLVIELLTYGFIPSKITYGDDTIRFSGMYGFEIGITEIDKVELSDTLPGIKIRTNGFSFGPVKKGFFKLDKFGKTRLLIHSDAAPYLTISKSNGDKIIVNSKGRIETERIYDKIRTLTDK